MVIMQIFASYESVQYKRSAFTFLFNGSLYGKKIKLSVTSAYIECATGSSPIAFFWSIDIGLLERSQLALYEISFERPASLTMSFNDCKDREKEGTLVLASYVHRLTVTVNCNCVRTAVLRYALRTICVGPIALLRTHQWSSCGHDSQTYSST